MPALHTWDCKVYPPRSRGSQCGQVVRSRVASSSHVQAGRDRRGERGGVVRFGWCSSQIALEEKAVVTGDQAPLERQEASTDSVFYFSPSPVSRY